MRTGSNAASGQDLGVGGRLRAEPGGHTFLYGVPSLRAASLHTHREDPSRLCAPHCTQESQIISVPCLAHTGRLHLISATPLRASPRVCHPDLHETGPVRWGGSKALVDGGTKDAACLTPCLFLMPRPGLPSHAVHCAPPPPLHRSGLPSRTAHCAPRHQVRQPAG